MTDFMLDTDICIYSMSGRYPILDRRLQEAGATLRISVIVVGELYFGAHNSRERDANRRRVDAFVSGLPIVDFDQDAADHHGEIRAHLRRAGTPIGPYDLLIGAHARSLGATLVTNNRREFDRIPDLAVENWAV